MVWVPPSLFSRVHWPKFEKITDLLMNHLDGITQDVLRAIAPGGDDPRLVVIDGDLGADRDD